MQGGLGRWLKCLALVILPATAFPMSTTVTWNPSTGTNVTGYTLYYGTASHTYTNSISLGNTTNADVGNLAASTTYFFAAKSHDAAGHESDYSNEAGFAGYHLAPGAKLALKNLTSTNGDQLAFSLAAGAPAGASINPTNGTISWITGLTNANTTNTITILITDLTNPSASRQMALLVTVSDYLAGSLPSVPVQTGHSANLPLSLATSDGVTNLAFNVGWPGGLLPNPSLTYAAPVAGGTLQNQGTNLALQLWTANGDAITSTNPFAWINFSAASGQPSAIISLPVSAVTATKTNGSAFSNPTFGSGEVVVVGVNPLLRPRVNAGTGRTLTLYANPGASYELYYATNLFVPVQWQSLLNYQPTNVEQTVSLDSANPVVFYRLVQP